MNKKSNKRLELVLWKLVPLVITFILLVFCTIPKHMGGIGYVMPVLTLIPIFYWGKLQISEVPYWFAFIIGLLTDIMSGTPIGMSAMLYLLFLALLHSQSKYLHKEGFVIIWMYFAVLLTVISIFQWLIISLLNGQVYSTVPAFLQLLITISLYPLFHHLFDKISEHTKQRRWILKHG